MILAPKPIVRYFGWMTTRSRVSHGLISKTTSKREPDFEPKFLACDNDFIAMLIVRVALMATSKVYLVFDKAWLEHPELRKLPETTQALNMPTKLRRLKVSLSGKCGYAGSCGYKGANGECTYTKAREDKKWG
jgi:hypothetical protein